MIRLRMTIISATKPNFVKIQSEASIVIARKAWSPDLPTIPASVEKDMSQSKMYQLNARHCWSPVLRENIESMVQQFADPASSATIASTMKSFLVNGAFLLINQAPQSALIVAQEQRRSTSDRQEEEIASSALMAFSLLYSTKNRWLVNFRAFAQKGFKK